MSKTSIRDTVLRSLSAIGATKEAKFYAELFAAQDAVRQKSRRGMIPILEMTERRGKMSLHKLVTELKPNKVIFLQPSGGLSHGDERLSFVNIDRLEETLNPDDLTLGQSRFISLVQELAIENNNDAVYVIASPLNLLAELFTTKGSGTMLRRAAPIMETPTLARVDKAKLKISIEEAFNKQPRKVRALRVIFGIRCARIHPLFSGARAWVTPLTNGICTPVMECRLAAIGVSFGRAWTPQRCQAPLLPPPLRLMILKRNKVLTLRP